MSTPISQEPFSVDVTVQGANPGINYLRIDFFKEGTTNYFGETFNGNDWYSGSEGNLYASLTIGEDKIATSTVKGRVGIPTAHEYLGPGFYKMRVRRYTTSGKPAETDQMPVDVEIVVPVVSPTPRASPAPTSFIPTPISVATPVMARTLLTSSPTARKLPRIFPRPSVNEEQSVLGVEHDAEPSPLSIDPSPPPRLAPSFGFTLLGVGSILSGLAGFLVYRQSRSKLI